MLLAWHQRHAGTTFLVNQEEEGRGVGRSEEEEERGVGRAVCVWGTTPLVPLPVGTWGHAAGPLLGCERHGLVLRYADVCVTRLTLRTWTYISAHGGARKV